MKKYFLIQSIHRDERKGDEDGWVTYNITPIVKGLNGLSKMIDEYNEGNKKTITLEVYGVKGEQTAVVLLRGPRARVEYFPTVLLTTNFYEYFSLREVTYPDIYV